MHALYLSLRGCHTISKHEKYFAQRSAPRALAQFENVALSTRRIASGGAEMFEVVASVGRYRVRVVQDDNMPIASPQSPVPPQYVFWYHNARMINYDAAAGVTVLTEPGPKTQSALAIRRAAHRHSGNYTCRAANTEPAHIYVYVSEGSECRREKRAGASPAVAAVELRLVVVLAGDKMAATLSRSSSEAAPLTLSRLALVAAALLAPAPPARHAFG